MIIMPDNTEERPCARDVWELGTVLSWLRLASDGDLAPELDDLIQHQRDLTDLIERVRHVRAA